MKHLRPILFVLFILICSSLLAFATAKLKTHRKNLPMELVRGEALMVDPQLLKVVAGEFKGLLADYLLIKAAIIDGGEPEKMMPEDWEAVYILYKQSLALDPYFYQTAYYTQGNLVWRDGMAEKANDLLQISADHRTWDWNPLWYLGFNYAHFFKDRVKGSQYFFDAAKKPGAPPILGVLAARLSQGQGDTLTSIAILKAMYELTENKDFKRGLKRRIEAHVAVYQLEQAIIEYKKRFNRLPAMLDDLTAAGIISMIPPHPYEQAYHYDPKTGRVDYAPFKNK